MERSHANFEISLLVSLGRNDGIIRVRYKLTSSLGNLAVPSSLLIIDVSQFSVYRMNLYLTLIVLD